MKALSQSEYGELRDIYERVYAPEAETILEGFTDEDLDLTDEEIEEQIEEVFLECIEEGYDIDEIERAICEAVDAELQVLNEVTSPAKVAALRMKNQNAAAAGEGRGGDAGAKARAKLNVSKQKVGGSSEKKASTLSRVKSAASKVKSGLKAAGKVAQGTVGVAARAVGTAQRAASAVKGAAKSGYERGRQGTSSTSSTSSASGGSSSASGASSSDSSDAPKKRKDGLLKRAIKKVVRGAAKVVSTGAGAVKAGADYVSNRARKESMNHTDVKTIQELYNSIYESQDVEEVYKGKHGQSDKEYADSRSQGGKMVSGDSKQSGAEYTHGRRVKAANPGMQPDVGGKTKPKSQGKMDRGTRADLEYRKANLKKEELEAIGEDSRRMSNKQHTQRVRSNIKSFGSNYTPPSNYDPDANRGQGEVLTAKQMEKKRRKALRQEELEATGLFTVKEIEAIMEAEMSEAMSSYDRNRKRAAERAAARNAARDAGKTGVVPGVGYVTPRREKETYVDSAGTTRHKSGAKMPKEEFELDENRRAARAAGGYKDDSKKQTDPSKAGFTGISNSIADIMRQNKEIEARSKKK